MDAEVRRLAEAAVERMGFSPRSTSGQWMVGIVADAITKALRREPTRDADG